MSQFEANAKTGERILAKPDKDRPGHFYSGFALSRDGKMHFLGGFTSEKAAMDDARRRLKEAKRKSASGK